MNSVLVRLIFWFVALALFPIPAALIPRSFVVEVLQPETSVATSSALSGTIPLALPPEERALRLEQGWEFTERVLVYLEQSEKKEIDSWLRDDLRIAWITVKWSQSGVPDWVWLKESPYVSATFQVLQCRPDDVWPRIVAKRKEKLGCEYARFFSPVETSAKKPCVRERRRTRRNAVASGSLAA
jgi:hypothetical protein